MKPTGLLPADIRASFMAAMTEAKMGADAEVPPLVVNLPSIATTVGNLTKRAKRRCELRTHAQLWYVLKVVLTHWRRRRGTRARSC